MPIVAPHRKLDDAQRALAAQWARLAFKLAREFCRRRAPDVPVAELLSAASFALVRAARGYDESLGIPFPGYAKVGIFRGLADAARAWRQADWPRQLPADADGREWDPAAPESTAPAEAAAVAACRRLRGALPARLFDPLWQHHAEGQTLPAVAARLGVTPMTVQNRLNRAAYLARQARPADGSNADLILQALKEADGPLTVCELAQRAVGGTASGALRNALTKLVRDGRVREDAGPPKRYALP